MMILKSPHIFIVKYSFKIILYKSNFVHGVTFSVHTDCIVPET